MRKVKPKKIFLLVFILSLTCVFSRLSLAEGQTTLEPTSQIEVLFSPQDNCAQKIVSAIDNAKSYVYVVMYFLTSRPIAQALVKAKDRGVDVKICMDKGQPQYEYSKDKFLEDKGVDLKLIGGSGIMHNKFCVIDDYVTITGSYNWTARADLENDENVLIIRSKEIANIYKTQFNRYWNGTYVDTCVYKDEDRLEKISVAIGTAAPIVKPSSKGKYLGHKSTKKFHYPDCKWAKKIKPENQVWLDSRQQAIDKGYVPCKVCNP